MKMMRSAAAFYMNTRRQRTEKGNFSGLARFSIEENGKLPDYRTYKLNHSERIAVMGIGILGIESLMWLFYRELLAGVLFSPLLILFYRWEAGRRGEQRRKRLAGEFRDGMQALAAALRAGYSVENAFSQAERELKRIHGADGLLSLEFAWIVKRLRMNETVETAMTDLAERSGLDDVREMAQIFAIAKRSGGKLPEILQRTAGILEEKVRLQEEIRTLITAKRLEQRMMSLMPAAILAYVGITSPEFLAPLYQGVSGRAIMTVCLIVYGFAVYLGERIIKKGVTFHGGEIL